MITNARTYEWTLQVRMLQSGAPWLTVPAVTGLAPAAPQRLIDTGTYARGGNPGKVRTGEDFSLAFRARVSHEDRALSPPLSLLVSAADTGAGVEYRYWNTAVAALCYQGTAMVTWSRSDTGNTGIEFFDITLAGLDDRAPARSPLL